MAPGSLFTELLLFAFVFDFVLTLSSTVPRPGRRRLRLGPDVGAFDLAFVPGRPVQTFGMHKNLSTFPVLPAFAFAGFGFHTHGLASAPSSWAVLRQTFGSKQAGRHFAAPFRNLNQTQVILGRGAIALLPVRELYMYNCTGGVMIGSS